MAIHVVVNRMRTNQDAKRAVADIFKIINEIENPVVCKTCQNCVTVQQDLPKFFPVGMLENSSRSSKTPQGHKCVTCYNCLRCDTCEYCNVCNTEDVP